MFNKFKVKDIITDHNKLNGFYNGTVVDTVCTGYKDDGNPISRVKVEIPELTKGIKKEYLPFYVVKQKFNTSPNSQATIPPVGSEIIVEFPTNDIYNGICSYVLVSSPPS